MNYLPDKLTNLRKHYNYSQKHLAKVLDIDIVDYMGIENGRTVLNNEQIIKLSKFYYIDYIELFRNDEHVTLYDVNNQDTDKINIEYFIPKKTFFNVIKKTIKKHKIVFSILSLIIVSLIAFSIYSDLSKPEIDNKIIDINTLSASNRSVLFLNKKGIVRGSGDNSFSQLSNLPNENVAKVVANDKYSVFLFNDGSLQVCGECEKDIKDVIEKTKNAIDIGVGDSHLIILDSLHNVVCIGDNSKNQCVLNGTQKIKKVFARKNASIVIGLDGSVKFCGDFIGRSNINDSIDILDIDVSNTSSIYLKSDGTVDYSTNLNNKYYIESLKWDNISNVACGDNFLVGLKTDGTVVVASNDESIVTNASKLNGIVSIDAADKYFIAFDGSNIYGFGENKYQQFVPAQDEIVKLPSVVNPTIECKENVVIVSFEPIINASSYEITFNNIVNKYSNNLNITLDASFLKKDETYNLSIKAIGNEYYIDSDVANFSFKYELDE